MHGHAHAPFKTARGIYMVVMVNANLRRGDRGGERGTVSETRAETKEQRH